MKRFRFSLETLLSLRKEREQECEIVLASAAGKLATIENGIEAARLAGERAFSEGGSSLYELQARELLWMKSKNDRKSLEQPRIEATAKVDSARKIYSLAHSERAALDKLREKRMDQWKFSVKQEEIKRLDETAKGAVARRRLTGGDE
jgi:flagellar export protein FliJ